MTTIVNEFNLASQMVFNKKELLENMKNNGIYASLNWPITRKWGYVGSGSYTLCVEANDIYNEIVHNKKRPDSEITQIWNRNSPFKKALIVKMTHETTTY